MKLLRALTSWAKKPVPIIDEHLWREATHRYGFMTGLSDEENRRLRLIASDFLSRKSIVGAGDFDVTPRMQIEIAAQACILVLELGVDYYDGWSDVIVYPGEFLPEREVVDEIGVVHTTRDPLAGEAWLGGPVILSYEDVARVGTDHAIAGFNVVIHEFAHKLDMLNGDANGYPPLPKGMSSTEWQQTFKAAYLEFCKQVDAADARSLHDGGAMLDALVLDPYASESPAEFFAVISESFFDSPLGIQQHFPEVYRLLAQFYRQDPARRQGHQARS
jgi:Mlc titration factor MtfA (ptsG expression regulator)